VQEGVKSRQILIDFNRDPATGQIPFLGDSITMLKATIDKALCDCKGTDDLYRTRAVTRLRNSGILAELDSEEAVMWFTTEGTREKFLEKLHPAARIKPRAYHVVVQFIPLTLRTDRVADLRKIEEVNGLDKGEVIKARWIKPAVRRRPSQTCSHLILSFQTPQSANDTLANSLFICQKKVYTEKCKDAPLRC